MYFRLFELNISEGKKRPLLSTDCCAHESESLTHKDADAHVISDEKVLLALAVYGMIHEVTSISEVCKFVSNANNYFT